MKIAVPVDTDKKTIVQRTGRAPFFAIYEDDKLLDVVEVASGEGHHGHENGHDEHVHEDDEEHVQGHKKDIMGINGCDVVLFQMIGEHMREAIESLGIKLKKIRKKDGSTADEVVKNFLANS